jgi:hypothetical protein
MPQALSSSRWIRHEDGRRPSRHGRSAARASDVRARRGKQGRDRGRSSAALAEHPATERPSGHRAHSDGGAVSSARR